MNVSFSINKKARGGGGGGGGWVSPEWRGSSAPVATLELAANESEC